MSLETEVAALTTATTNLLAAVNVKKTALDNAVAYAEIDATRAEVAFAALAGYGLAPIAYTAGLVVNDAARAYEYNDVVYYPKLSMLPFTTSGTFETAKFRLAQGATIQGVETLTNKTLSGGTPFVTNGARIGITSEATALPSPGALVHIVNKHVTAGLRVSSYWQQPFSNNDCLLLECYNKTTSDSLNLSWALSAANWRNDIPVGVTDTGQRVGVLGWAVSASPGEGHTHAGTLEYQFGVRGRAGFQGVGTPTTAVINNAIGVRGEIYLDSPGTTIVNAHAGEFLANAPPGVQNNYAVYADAFNGSVVNYAFYGYRGKMINFDQILAGATFTESSSKIAARGVGNAFEFGFPSAGGYASNLGVTLTSGRPFLGFHCEAGTGDTFTTRGIKGNAIFALNDGTLLFSQLTAANTANQAQTERARLTPAGQFIFAETVALRTKTPASATAAGLFGEFAFDDSYVYACIATNTWKRAALATW